MTNKTDRPAAKAWASHAKDCPVCGGSSGATCDAGMVLLAAALREMSEAPK